MDTADKPDRFLRNFFLRTQAETFLLGDGFPKDLYTERKLWRDNNISKVRNVGGLHAQLPDKMPVGFSGNPHSYESSVLRYS